MLSSGSAVPATASLSEIKRTAIGLEIFMGHSTIVMIGMAMAIVLKSGGLTPFSTGGILFALLSLAVFIRVRKYVHDNVTVAEKAQVSWLERLYYTVPGVLIPFVSMTLALAPYLR